MSREIEIFAMLDIRLLKTTCTFDRQLFRILFNDDSETERYIGEYHTKLYGLGRGPDLAMLITPEAYLDRVSNFASWV